MAKGWWRWERRGFMQNLWSGPFGEQAKLGFITLSLPRSLQQPTGAPHSYPEGSSAWQLSFNCRASGVRPPVLAEPGTPHVMVPSLHLCNWLSLSP